MSLSINTNTAAMAALQSLNQTTADLTQTENAVSTGKSVNTASDNPAMYSIAQNMTAQISTLSGVSTGLAFSAQVLNTATTGLSSISSALQSLATTIGTNTTGVDNSTLNDAITKTLASIDSAATGAKFQGVNLLSGQTGNGTTYTSLSTAMDAQGSTFTQNGFNVTSAGLGLSNLSMDTAGMDIALGSTNYTGSQSLKLSSVPAIASTGTGSTATAAMGSATDPLVSYNFVMDEAGTQVDALTALNTASGGTFSLVNGKLQEGTSTTTSTTASDGSVTFSLANGKSVVASKDGNGNAVYTVTTGTDANGNATAKTVISDVDLSGATGNATATTTGSPSQLMVNKTNLLTQAMQYQGFAVSRDSSNNLTVAGNNLDTSSTALTAANGLNSSATPTAVTGAAVVSTIVQAAISSVTRTASTIGYSSTTISNLQTTTSSLSDALTTGVGALTDADLAAESAKLTSLQTKQQLAVQSLSIANSQSSTLLSLFRG
ncbi:flagellin [Gluconobacter kondonii]|uniref:flagellin n=1 Tax=Gluconobacter kondonii TaxID=941463 RepID=UPI001B8B4A77|nr:flagellin [Gluconobacter kondonii]MBS1052614.1 flagellin [Gluconobacter kondonii]MBS1056007.1 flagellin [Gluconobacter kondonii]MBS1082151.1 flagellin [Gluconobacter kondonii]